MKSKTLKPNGFTLIELMVSVFMFSILMIVVESAFVSSLDMQRRAFSIQQSEENANFMLESMAKEIRVSKVSGPDSDCQISPAATLNIVHPVNGNVTYSLSGTAIHRTVNGQDTIISSNTIQFTRLRFCVSGSALKDNKQPRVTILASVRSASLLQQVSIDIQTTLSQRPLSP